MTHMTNYGNDRLALYTFEGVSKFINCWTNLQLKTRTPLELADRYFQLYPDETDAIWHVSCAIFSEAKASVPGASNKLSELPSD